MIGYKIIEMYRIGAVPIILLHNPDREKPWCVMRTGTRFFLLEEDARACLECLLNSPTRCPQQCFAMNPKEG